MAVRRTSSGSLRHARSNSVAKVVILAIAIIAAAFIARGTKAPAQASVQREPMVVAEFDTVSVPVPSEPVAIGTKIKDIRWKTMPFPRHQLPAGALLETTSHSEAVTVAPLPANLPVFSENLSTTTQAINPVVERIPSGMRAMTIRVDATTAVEGWAGSGSLVDVLLIAKDRTTVVAEKVKILSAERSVAPVEGKASPNVPSTVTLLVTQEQCLAINTAIPLGKIAFALRSAKDEESWIDTTFTADQLRNNPSVNASERTITGYVSVRNDEGKRSFALTNGKWIATDIKPTGFLAAQEDQAR